MNREDTYNEAEDNLKKCVYIKALVEDRTGIFDISVTKRHRNIADAKKIYCKLCKRFTTATLRIIGQSLGNNYDHASVLHSIAEFDKLYKSRQLTYIQEYDDIVKSIIDDDVIQLKNYKILDELRLFKKYRNDVSELKKENERLTKQNTVLKKFINDNAEKLILN